RDQDTAEMAFRAAMTGHQVYSTLHTNSALGAVPRLLDLGVLPDIMADNIIGVIGQRLVRKLCPVCKAPYTPNDTERQLLGMTPEQKDQTIYRAVGCEECDHRGYKGRLSLMEIIRMEGYLEALIAERANIHVLKQQAIEHGFSSLAEDGSRRVLEGITSLDEVSRVINMTDRIA
ncbi:MAG: ATPase, T2SS/T4P/T4SS family, partial [Pseudomonadota bacterium]